MTTTLIPVSPTPAADHAAAPPHSANRAAFAIYLRLMRRGALWMWFTMAAYMVMEIYSYRAAYPDEASRERLLKVSTSSAVQMMQGVPGAITTPEGFAVWDAGWMMMFIIGIWAALMMTKLSRGEEDTGRADVLLSRPVRAASSLRALLAAVSVVLLGIGVASAVPLVLLGEQVEGSLLWGAGLAGFGFAFASLAALCAQLVEPRRRAASLVMSLMAAAYLLRVVANSSDDRHWLLSLTPFGWVDRLGPFSGNSWWWLAAPLAVAAWFAAVASALCARRDVGAATITQRETRPGTLRMTGSAAAFGWRLTSGALAAWLVALTMSSMVFGLLTGVLVDFISQDENYRRLLESMGMDMSSPIIGFLSYMANFMALPFAMYIGWRMGAFRQEEAEGRLDNLLVRGVARGRLALETTLLGFGATVLLVAGSTAGMWAGARLAAAPVSLSNVLEPMLGTLPFVALSAGVAALTFGLMPRLTVAVPVALAVLSYLLDTFGSMLHWPTVVVALSPLHHLARLPGSPMTGAAIVVMVGLGAAMGTIGVMAFSRRDVRGA